MNMHFQIRAVKSVRVKAADVFIVMQTLDQDFRSVAYYWSELLDVSSSISLQTAE